jgi:hypothetical protein
VSDEHADPAERDAGLRVRRDHQLRRLASADEDVVVRLCRAELDVHASARVALRRPVDLRRVRRREPPFPDAAYTRSPSGWTASAFTRPAMRGVPVAWPRMTVSGPSGCQSFERPLAGAARPSGMPGRLSG